MHLSLYIIKNVWEAIALTGQVPMPVAREAGQDRRKLLFDRFVEFADGLPPCSPATAAMDDRAMRALIAERYV